MPTFKEFLGIKPKQPKQETQPPRRRYGTSPEDVAAEKAEIEENRRKAKEKREKENEVRMEEIEKAKEKFQSEKLQVEWRLKKIPAEIEEQERTLAELKGPEMRKILDKEFDLNSKQSPISSTDPNRRVEYDMWVRALHDSRAAVQWQKADLGRRIDECQGGISKLEKEKKEIESRIQRGY